MVLPQSDVAAPSRPSASDSAAPKAAPHSLSAGNEFLPSPTNAAIAQKLGHAADLLAAQDADWFRVAAYRKAADSVRALGKDIAGVYETGGRAALEAIPGIGVSISAAIIEMLTTGRWAFLDHLKGAAGPEELFQSIPGIGQALARRLCKILDVATLEELEMAAHDGRLERVPGFGRRRAAIVRTALAELLARIRPPRVAAGEEPEVGLLFEVDAEYRGRAAAGDLPKIAPKRFNPRGEAWLPVLHTRRGDWHFTAIFSNTARAHQLHRTGDWVVIYFAKDRQPGGQRTVVTETAGALAGHRVVRGREAEGAR